MYAQGWRPDTMAEGESEDQLLKKVEMNWRKMAVIVIFILQYLIIALYPLMGGDSNLTFDFMIAVMICTMILVGIIGGMNADELGQSFAKGLASMAFVAFVIGMAKVISLVLDNGNVIHTIVYVLTKPLLELPKSVASVGLTVIVSIINPIIPSATSKAAILVPIMKPVADALGLQPNLAVVAYQMGDSLTNTLTPVSGPLTGALGLAGVDYTKWVRYSAPLMGILAVIACIFIAVLSAIGWMG